MKTSYHCNEIIKNVTQFTALSAVFPTNNRYFTFPNRGKVFGIFAYSRTFATSKETKSF